MSKEQMKTKGGKFLKPAGKRSLPVTIALALLLGICALCFFAGSWYLRIYGDTGFDSVIYTLTSSLGGVQSELIVRVLLGAVLPALVCTGLGTAGLIMLRNTRRQRIATRSAVLMLSLVMISYAAVSTGFIRYVKGQFQDSPIFEQYYVKPGQDNITFPEKKRNLIYIFLESMEISYLAEDQGGAQDVNLIPELYDLADKNLNFSHNLGVGGFLPVPGTTWTIGAMVGHTSGVPLKLPPDVEENDYGQHDEGFLPGIVSLADILDEEGYYQTLMVGSVASFGGRRQYYLEHGADHVYDISTARKDGIVPRDYFVWWGMEDKYLFEYAKQELEEISGQDQPFAFTMLTVDTHHIGGYVCEYCGSEHDEQYENVMSCSSRQVAEFVEWIQDQDFYENTTIVITGDHLSMDQGYFNRNVEDTYTRRNYNCFINSAADTTANRNRRFCALDMFPTTLAALGCTIEGDRLGLGTNLFSGKITLIEQLGYEEFCRQLAMDSDYYASEFRLEFPEETPEETTGE